MKHEFFFTSCYQSEAGDQSNSLECHSERCSLVDNQNPTEGTELVVSWLLVQSSDYRSLVTTCPMPTF